MDQVILDKSFAFEASFSLFDLARSKLGIIVVQTIAHSVCGTSSSVLVRVMVSTFAILKTSLLLQMVKRIAFQ